MATEVLFRLGPPPWAEVEGHPCLKYATAAAVRKHCSPWVQRAVERMAATLPSGPLLVDVRWWPWLDIGQIPGVPGAHYDCYNVAERAVDDEHRLYFFGAGCRTLFLPTYQPEEGDVVAYGHADIHQIMPATVAGPRILIRCSRTSIRAANHVYSRAHIHREAAT